MELNHAQFAAFLRCAEQLAKDNEISLKYKQGYCYGLQRFYHGHSFRLPDKLEQMMDPDFCGQDFAEGFTEGFEGRPPKYESGLLGNQNARKYSQSTMLIMRCETFDKTRWMTISQRNNLSLTEAITRALNYAVANPEVLSDS